MLSKSKLQSITKSIEKHMERIAADRDKLDDFIDTLQALKEDCDNAYDALITARDALSELV